MLSEQNTTTSTPSAQDACEPPIEERWNKATDELRETMRRARDMLMQNYDPGDQFFRAENKAREAIEIAGLWFERMLRIGEAQNRVEWIRREAKDLEASAKRFADRQIR